MDLSSALVKSFASTTNDSSKASRSNETYGTIVGQNTVRLDGSTLVTPCVSTVSTNPGDRVIVKISSHTATIVGNVTSPAYDQNATGQYVEGYVSTVLEADYLKVSELEAKYAKIEYLEANYITVDTLKATHAEIDFLEADLANITNLLAGNVGVAGSLQAIHITSDNVVIDDATISNAMIGNISASKITSGYIYTKLVKIASDEDENLLLDGSTIQIKDKNKVARIQIGKDADGDYSMYIWDASGNLLWRPTGITGQGLGNGTVKNMNVASDAAIDGSKLNITSVAEKLNENGSITVTGSQVKIDNTTLSAVYKSITSDISENNKALSVLQTQFEEVNGKITAKVWQSDINSSLKSLSDRYAELVITLDGITSKVEKLDMYTTAEELLLDSSGNVIFDSSGSNLDGWHFVDAYSVIKQNTDSITAEVTRATNEESKLSSRITQTSTDITAEVSRATKSEGELLSLININADAIVLRVSKGSVISEINQTSESVKISASKITFEGLVTANNNFLIKTDGSIEAKNAIFHGKITATSGFIGSDTSGWRISSNNIRHYRYISADNLYYDYFFQAADTTSSNMLAIRQTRTAPSSGSSNADYVWNNSPTWFYKFSVNYKGELVLRYVDSYYSNGTPQQFSVFSFTSGILQNRCYYNNSSGTSTYIPNSVGYNLIAKFRARNWHSPGVNAEVWTDYASDGIDFRGKSYISFECAAIGSVDGIHTWYPVFFHSYLDMGTSSIRAADSNATIVDCHTKGQFYYGAASGYTDDSNLSVLRGKTVRLYCHSGGGVYLGSSGSTAITSDERLKDIFDIDDKYIDFFENLNPIAYKYKVGHRTHLGFGARAVEQALNDAGLSTEEFAGILIQRNVNIGKDECMHPDGITFFEELYSLRYEEFTALNTLMIQKLLTRIQDLESRLQQSAN